MILFSCEGDIYFLNVNFIKFKIFKHTDSYWITLFISDYTATNSPCKKTVKLRNYVISSRPILPLLFNYKKLQCCFSIIFYCAHTHTYTHTVVDSYITLLVAVTTFVIYTVNPWSSSRGAPQERWMLYTH